MNVNANEVLLKFKIFSYLLLLGEDQSKISKISCPFLATKNGLKTRISAALTFRISVNDEYKSTRLLSFLVLFGRPKMS